MQYILFFILLLLPSQALAIINAEGFGINRDQQGFNGKLSASLNGSSGNTVKITSELGGRAAWLSGAHTGLLIGSYAFGKSRGVRDTNKTFLHTRYRFALDSAWAVETFAQAQKDEFARLKLRTLFGGGIRWSREWNRGIVAWGAGSFYEIEKLRRSTTGVISPRTRLWRINSYGSLAYQPNDQITLMNTLYFQPAWRDRADYRLLESASLAVKLAEHLDLRLSLDLAKDAKPPAGVKAVDASYKTGLE